MRPKKAQIFSAGLVIVTLLVLASLGVTLSLKEAKITEQGDFGEFSAKIFDAYGHKQSLLFTLDRLASYAALESLHDLAENAGLDKTQCGDYDNYAVLDVGSNDCSPTNKTRRTNFLILFRQRISDYLKSDGYLNSISKEYNFTLGQENSLTITGDLSGKIEITEEEAEDISIVYTIHPPFTIQLDYDMKDYSRVIVDSKKLIGKCKDNSTLKLCVENEVVFFNMAWSLAQDPIPNDRILKFDVASKKKYLYYNSIQDNIEFKPVVIKFALQI